MLEHVSVGQARFNTPGIACDARGVAMGRALTVLLPSIDRAVALFRGLSERLSLDDLLPTSRLARVKTEAGAQELLVRLPVNSSHVADTCAAVARLVGGLAFTGTSRHFVSYRDSASPLGYDIEMLIAGDDDFVLYGRDFVQSYRAVGDLDPVRLLLALSLQRRPGDWPEERERVLLRIERGLWSVVLTYLHRRGVSCSVAAGVKADVTTSGDQNTLFLLTVEQAPAPMLRLFRELPGVQIYRMCGDKAAIELGFEHPLVLESCASLFGEHALYLFSGQQNRLEVFPESPEFVPSRAVVGLKVAAREEPAIPLQQTEAEQVRVSLRLVASGAVQRPVVATRIPRDDAARLKKLVYLLPPTVLSTCQICVTSRSIYIYAPEGSDYLPVGELFWAPATHVFVPIGHQLTPAIAPELLRQQLGAGPDDLFFWQRSAPEVHRLSLADFAPLGRVAVADLPITRPVELPLSEENEAEVAQRDDPSQPQHSALINDDVGAFPLWGFSDTGGEP